MGAFDIQVTNLINIDITKVAMTNLTRYLANAVILENIKIFYPCVEKIYFPEQFYLSFHKKVIFI